MHPKQLFLHKLCVISTIILKIQTSDVESSTSIVLPSASKSFPSILF